MASHRGQQARELVEAIGEDGLAVLLANYRGLRIRVHVDPNHDSELARNLGDPVYTRLQAVCAGELLDVPRLRRTRKPGRAVRVRELSRQGLTANEIARTEDISLRWVRALLARPK